MRPSNTCGSSSRSHEFNSAEGGEEGQVSLAMYVTVKVLRLCHSLEF